MAPDPTDRRPRAPEPAESCLAAPGATVGVGGAAPIRGAVCLRRCIATVDVRGRRNRRNADAAAVMHSRSDYEVIERELRYPHGFLVDAEDGPRSGWSTT